LSKIQILANKTFLSRLTSAAYGKLFYSLFDSAWSDKTTVDYTNFAPGAPAYDGGNLDGDCIFMYGTDSPYTGAWSNKACAAPDQHAI